MPTQGFLGIDAGTQGLSVIFTDQSMNVLATGEGGYDMLPGLDDGCYEQLPPDWTAALQAAMGELRPRLPQDFEVLAIGISGQMHGEVLVDSEDNPLCPARLWCDARNESEGHELTEELGVKMPKRITSARWLATLRERPQLARQVTHLTTPAGWIAGQLTGEWNLGIGDAAGMFPIDPSTLDYDARRLELFDGLADHSTPLKKLLPTVRVAGEDGGQLNAHGAELLGLPEGIPVAPAEGDQPAALAGSLIADAGMVSVSFGTSVCANSVGDRAFQGVDQAIDHFCAPDGKPINMVFLRNGTTFMNSIVGMFGQTLAGDPSAGFDRVMPLVLAAAPDCGGLLALPFMDDEPGLGVGRGGNALLTGFTSENASPGNAVKSALLATMFNLKFGSQPLDAQQFPRTEIGLSGGLTRTPELAQILADVFATPVTLLTSSEEGTAFGASLLAKFRHASLAGNSDNWSSFLKRHASENQTRFEPHPDSVKQYESVYKRYRKLLTAHVENE